jgi:hypothetical protein
MGYAASQTTLHHAPATQTNCSESNIDVPFRSGGGGAYVADLD